jgi:hypothetical protein
VLVSLGETYEKLGDAADAAECRRRADVLQDHHSGVRS